jgi:hypothetical protein
MDEWSEMEEDIADTVGDVRQQAMSSTAAQRNRAKQNNRRKEKMYPASIKGNLM